ncbi:MAG: ABC transporter permease [Bacteroidaceae bacterium]|nr:ABC transporter permease [Bacteroidaceae bacterium]MDO4993633.1 permease-like cell division protein FtsX [Bacteroidales bacterium]
MGHHHHHRSKFFSTQFMTACISTTLVLVLLGMFVLFMLIARNLSAYVRENINVTVLISDDLPEDSIKILKADLKGMPCVKSLQYISKEEALREQTEAMGTDPSEFIGYNPFTASFEMKMKADYANNDSLARIVKRLKADERVMDVLYQKELLQAVNDNIRKVSLVLLIIAALFTYISFQLINNTVRLTIFSRRFSINTMKLVGASWGFIRKPFLQRAATLGVVSALAADAILYFGYHWLQKYEPEINTVVNLEVLLIVGGSVLVFGLLITFLCTYGSLSRYLRMTSNELYHV